MIRTETHLEDFLIKNSQTLTKLDQHPSLILTMPKCGFSKKAETKNHRVWKIVKLNLILRFAEFSNINRVGVKTPCEVSGEGLNLPQIYPQEHQTWNETSIFKKIRNKKHMKLIKSSQRKGEWSQELHIRSLNQQFHEVKTFDSSPANICVCGTPHNITLSVALS